MSKSDYYTTDTGEKRHPSYWECREIDGGCLDHETIDEAVEYHLDDLDRADWPEKLTVYGYAPCVAKVPKGRVLECLLTDLDSEYGAEFSDGTEPTKRMLEAEEAFVGAVLAEYGMQTCEVLETVVIDVQDWVKANAPSWLEGKRRPWERV